MCLPWSSPLTLIPTFAIFAFFAQVNELSSVGTPVLPAPGGSGPVLAYSKDSWAVLTYTIAAEAPGCAGCFALNSSTGAISLGPNGGALNFNSATSFNMTVRVTYPSVGTDAAAVTVWLREINKPSIWSGLFNASTGASMTSITIPETSTVGSSVGRVSFSDPNTAYPWNARIYSIDPGTYGASFFAINSSSGVVSLAPPGGLSWWDAPTYSLLVSCTDADPYAPLTTTQTLTVNLIQVNTVSITAFDVPWGTPVSAGVNASDSVVVQTGGGTVVEVRSPP